MSLAENPDGSYAEEALQKYGYQQTFPPEGEPKTAAK
jgi:hypothetical protein